MQKIAKKLIKVMEECGYVQKTALMRFTSINTRPAPAFLRKSTRHDGSVIEMPSSIPAAKAYAISRFASLLKQAIFARRRKAPTSLIL